jgi:mannitol/fructose-specific phosphotransferase system IIA component (Ntr-type)
VNLASLVDARDVVINLAARDIADASAQLLRKALERRGVDAAEIQRLLGRVAARERELPTACGEAAIPHARDPHVQSFVAAIGVNAKGVIIGQPQPRVIFTFLSPEKSRSEHLELLASFSRLSCTPAVIEALVNAQSGDDVVKLLQGDAVGVVLVRE